MSEGICPVSTLPNYYSFSPTTYQPNHPTTDRPIRADFSQIEETTPSPPSLAQGALGGAFGSTPLGCDCYGTNLVGDGGEDAFDYTEYQDEWTPEEAVVDADGDSMPDEIPSEIEGEDYFEYFDESTSDEIPSEVEGEAAPSVCDHWPETFDLISPADGTIRVPYYTDSALNITIAYPTDPDEAIGDIVTCEAEIDDNRSFSSPVTRAVPDTGVLSFTPAVPSEYFVCATDYWARVRCFDSCTTETHEVVSSPRRFTTGPTVEWTRTYNGAGDGSDVGSGVAIDSGGNAYVIGTTQVGSEWWLADIWIRKYDINGNAIWTQTFDGPIGGNDEGNDIATDDFGYVYTIGTVSNFFLPMGGNTDVWIGKYDISDGSQRWIRYYDSPGASTFDFDAGYGIAVDNSTGNIWGTGYGSLSGLGLDVLWLGSYTNSGGVRFEQTEDTGGDFGWDIAIGNSGNAFVVSSINVPGEGSNIWAREYDSGGTPVWTETYNGPANDNDSGYGISTNASGDIFITGSEGIGGGSYRPWTGMYDGSTRSLIWAQTVGGRRNGIDANNRGSVFTAGTSTVRLNASNGEILCSAPESASVSTDVTADDSGNVYLTGSEDVPGEGSNIWVRRYSGF